MNQPTLEKGCLHYKKIKKLKIKKNDVNVRSHPHNIVFTTSFSQTPKKSLWKDCAVSLKKVDVSR